MGCSKNMIAFHLLVFFWFAIHHSASAQSPTPIPLPPLAQKAPPTPPTNQSLPRPSKAPPPPVLVKTPPPSPTRRPPPPAARKAPPPPFVVKTPPPSPTRRPPPAARKAPPPPFVVKTPPPSPTRRPPPAARKAPPPPFVVKTPPPPPSTKPQARPSVAVQGVVYCKSCKLPGFNKALGAAPLTGASVTLACTFPNKTFVAVAGTAKTDRNGFFLLLATKLKSSLIKFCKVGITSKLTDCSKLVFPLKPGKLIFEKETKLGLQTFALYNAGFYLMAPANGAAITCPRV